MTYLVIGNIIALIASLLMVYTGFIKKKDRILYVQTIQILLFVISSTILGGITGAIINALSCIRNILAYKDKLGIKAKLIIILLSIVLSLKFNNLGIIGLLPVVSSVLYIWLMNTKDIVKFKLLIIVTMIIWLIYDIYIKSYTSSIFDFATVIANCISIFQLIRSNNKNKNVV